MYDWSVTYKKWLKIKNTLIVDLFEVAAIDKKMISANSFAIAVVLRNKDCPENVYFNTKAERDSCFDEIWQEMNK